MTSVPSARFRLPDVITTSPVLYLRLLPRIACHGILADIGIHHIHVSPHGASLLQTEEHMETVTHHHRVLGYDKHVRHLLLDDDLHVHPLHQYIAPVPDSCPDFHLPLLVDGRIHLRHLPRELLVFVHERRHDDLLPDAHRLQFGL